jgi:hypothetical protein
MFSCAPLLPFDGRFRRGIGAPRYPKPQDTHVLAGEVPVYFSGNFGSPSRNSPQFVPLQQAGESATDKSV